MGNRGNRLIDSETRMYGVIGDPIGHSKSPVMMNAAFQALGINAAYTAFHVKPQQLREAIEGIKALQFGGLNVTIPHKLQVMDYLDEIDEGAAVIGAVNTIVPVDGKWVGYNTDGIGYVRSLIEETGISLKGKHIVVIGAGGAARGVIYALMLQQPGTIWVANRTREKAERLAADLNSFGDIRGLQLDELLALNERIDLVINTTSVGMHPHVNNTPLPIQWLKPEMLVSDLIYNPRLTELLKQAQQIGCRVHGGFGMFIYQGVYAFEYWTGKNAPVSVMRTAVERALI